MLPFLPLLVAFALLLLGRGPIVAALSGVAAVALLAAVGEASVSPAAWLQALHRTALLALSAAAVIFAGQYLNLLLQRNGAIAELSRRIESVPMDKALKTLLIVLGVAPAVESLTGFGVSLFLCVPLLLALYPPQQAAKISLLSMNIMPWGTLGLATLVGAGLAQLPPQTLGAHTALTSALAFPTIGMLTALVISRRLRVHGIALALGASLAAQLVLYNHLLSVELAGVLAGLGTAALGVLLFGAASFGAAYRGLLRAARPYAILLLLVALARASYPWWSEFSLAYSLTTRDGAMRFEWMTSPAVFLAATALFVRFADARAQSIGVGIGFGAVWAKSARPVISIALFLLLAQGMAVSGLLDAMVEAMVRLGGARGAVWISTALGMLSGYLTGSNLGGNALMMSVQAQLGAQSGEATLLAAIQNSGGGHAVFASLPIIVLTASIAKGMQVELDEARMIRFSMLCLLPIYLAIAVAAMALRGVG